MLYIALADYSESCMFNYQVLIRNEVLSVWHYLLKRR